MMDQTIACQRLIAAVIALAIKDACRGSRGKMLTSDLASALNFLFEHSDLYLSLLDIDPQHFRKRLVAYANSKKTGVVTPYNLTDFERRCFAMNYRRWAQEHEQVYSLNLSKEMK
jgi:hypothetical protein